MNAKTQAAVAEHGNQLLALFPQATERDPVNLCRKLRKLERRGAALALRLCNGPAFPSEDDVENESSAILGKIDALLAFRTAGIPVFVNLDPRGYALKIENEWMREHKPKLHHDWGGYGILAPDLTA